MTVIPQLYRGYIYSLVGDEVCYYLGSRFYSPKLGRFLNADKHFDTVTGVLGTNMFAYCNNNPVMNVDFSGNSSTLNDGIYTILAAFFVGVILESFMYYLNPNMEIAPLTKVKLDQNHMFAATARYKKSKILYNRLKIVFGDYYAWEISSKAYNNKTSVYYDHYTSYITDGYANPNDNPWSYILVNNFGLRPTVFISMITASAAKKVFNQIWGSSGIDKTNSKKLIVFKVTQDKNYNGVYYYSPSINNFIKVS